MPNHVINEVIFENLTESQIDEILAKAVNYKGRIDFSILLPQPLNFWRGSASEAEEKAFPGTWLDFQRHNWGTKWNAYGQNEAEEHYKVITREPGKLTLRFQTAWSPPMGWLCALYNSTDLPLRYAWLSEGGYEPKVGTMGFPHRIPELGEGWTEEKAPEAMARHLHKLMWGVEAFSDEEVSS